MQEALGVLIHLKINGGILSKKIIYCIDEFI